MNFNKESKCGVCGRHIGKGFDHSECAKVKQRTLKPAPKRSRKKLNAANVDYLTRKFGDT